MNPAWLFVIAVIVIVFLVMKISSTKQELAVKLVLILFVLLMLTMGRVYVKTNPDIKSFDGIVNFGGAYFSWLYETFGNIKDVSGYISQHGWSVESKNQSLKKQPKI